MQGGCRNLGLTGITSNLLGKSDFFPLPGEGVFQPHRLRLLGVIVTLVLVGELMVVVVGKMDNGGSQLVQMCKHFPHRPLESVFLLRQQSTLLPCASVIFTSLDLMIEAKKNHHAHHIIKYIYNTCIPVSCQSSFFPTIIDQ